MEPTALTDAAFDELADTLLDVAPVGFILLRPVYGAGGEGTVDMAYEFLNPAAQRLLLLPARPTESFLTLHPAEKAVFAFYCAAFGGAERAGYAGIMALAGTSFSFHLVTSVRWPMVRLKRATERCMWLSTVATSSSERRAEARFFS
ncbi:MAG: hypothetical protein EOO59_14920, partial [Hymenobacter sp.]